MIKMNIKAGLWRLCVFLVLGWIGSSIWYWRRELTATKSRLIDITPYGKGGGELTMKMLGPDGVVFEFPFSKFTQKEIDGVLLQHYGYEVWKNIPDWPARIDAAEWVFLPPMGLLLLGFAIVWVVNGFRRPT